MAYTAYRTWTTGEIVTAALMNEQVRDNGLLTAPAIMTTAGDIMYASAANTPARLAKSTSSTRVLTNTGTSNVPAWAQVTLTSGVTGTLPVANGGTNLTSLGSGVATFMGTPSSTNLRGALTDETGTGSAVFGTSPTLVTPALGTPASGVLTNATGLPEAGLAVSNSPTNGYMLTAQSGDAGGMTWAAAASGGLTRAGGNVTEASTTSTSTASILTASSLTIAVGSQVDIHAAIRKVTGATATAQVGLKLNSTQSRADTIWCSNGNENMAGLLYCLMFPYGVTNYSCAIIERGANNLQYVGSSLSGGMPTAELTDVIITGSVSSASITMYADELHIWTRSIS